MSDQDGRPRERERREVDVSGQEWGSDFVVDLLSAYGFEFAAFTPGSSFRGIEESIVNYNDGVPPVVETPHEGLSVAVAHGYAKATGEPALCLLHNVVGTLHGAMNLFNAYCDRVPMLALAGAGPTRRSKRRPFYDWIHVALDQGDPVEGFVKWTDQPTHMDDVAGSILRALRIAQTPPEGPTYVALDHDLQENRLDEPIPIPDFGKFAPPTPTAPDPDALERAADRLAGADLPVIVADRVGSSREGAAALADLAEALGAPVVPAFREGTPHRFTLPNTHPLDLHGKGVLREADAVLALDVLSPDFALSTWDPATHERTEVVEGEFDLIDVGMRDFRSSGLAGDEFRMRETDLSIAADAELASRALADAVRDRLDGGARERRDERRSALADRHDAQRAAWREEAEEVWDETPVSLARLASEVWDVIEGEEWTLVNGTLRGWAYRLWEIEEFDQYVGGYSGGGGIGHGTGHAIGAALAYEGERLPINLQPDGDLMFYPGGLWTIGHYGIPMLTVMHNNRTLYSSTRHRMELAEHRGRDASFEKAMVGTGLYEPTPDYATMAESMGVSGYGPVEDPDEIAPALREALADVKDGRPALVDVLCQPR